jgi:hypothetical protein
MLTEEQFFRSRNRDKIWQRYCGFLDLSTKEFMEIQENLLMEQIELVSQSTLDEKIMKGAKPKTVDEFRNLVPLTTYNDYLPYIGDCQEDALSEKPFCWVRTSGRGGSPKWVPYTEGAMDWIGRLGIALLILACATKKGEIRIGPGVRVMQNLPPSPYYTGVGASAMLQQLEIRMIPPLDETGEEDFEKRIQDGFLIALRTGVDVLGSLTTVLIRMGERFSESSGTMKISRNMLHPQIILRLIRAFLRSKREKRALLPKDLWPLKGLVCYGMDTSIYREKLIHYWGREPLELYGSTEAGLIAIQAWNKKGMTFFPFSCFLEFVPEEEWLKSLENTDYQPSTVLLDEVKARERYEIIITNFYGMPLLRYRQGDLIRIIDLKDKEAGIRLPQMVFESRSDDLINIAGFTRIDEKTIWQAIVNTELRYEDWSARKEYHSGQPVLHIYLEPKERVNPEEVEHLIHTQLKALDEDYKNLQDMLGIQPLKVTLLAQGSFQRYYEEKRKAGADLAHLKPPHMNAFDGDIQELLYLTQEQQEE